MFIVIDGRSLEETSLNDCMLMVEQTVERFLSRSNALDNESRIFLLAFFS
jgi:hypothetical protein